MTTAPTARPLEGVSFGEGGHFGSHSPTLSVTSFVYFLTIWRSKFGDQAASQQPNLYIWAKERALSRAKRRAVGLVGLLPPARLALLPLTLFTPIALLPDSALLVHTSWFRGTESHTLVYVPRILGSFRHLDLATTFSFRDYFRQGRETLQLSLFVRPRCPGRSGCCDDGQCLQDLGLAGQLCASPHSCRK